MRDTLDLPPGFPPIGLDLAARRALSGWLLLALGSLAVAGGLALLLALARTPGVQDWLPWPWASFFRKALVAHVVFAFVVWYMAMLGGLAAAARPGSATSLLGLALATAGAVLLLVPTLTNQGEASLNNYVPVLVHPLFFAGLALLAAGVALPVIHLLLRPPMWGGTLVTGVGSAGALYLLALVCFGLAWLALPPGAGLSGNGEQLFWGGGHLLQFVHTALLLTAWQVLGEQAFGAPPVPPRVWRWVCAGLVAAGLPGPVLYALHEVSGEALREAFTRLYWIGLPVPPIVCGLATLRAIVRGRGIGTRRPSWAFSCPSSCSASAELLGVFASGADARTPAHYHAAIGGVNLTFMALFFAILLPILLCSGETSRSLRLQFWLYGCGQGLFSLGMFIAGSVGVGRKVAGAEQDSTA